jgi:hypothetical protein
VREIRTLRAMWRVLETELRKLLTGHEGGNAGHSQGVSYEFVAPALDPTNEFCGPKGGCQNRALRGRQRRYILLRTGGGNTVAGYTRRRLPRNFMNSPCSGGIEVMLG